MENKKRIIFREETLLKHISGGEKTVLPKLISPRTFFTLWALLGVLSGIGLYVWLTKHSVYISGQGIILDSSGKKDFSKNRPRILAIFPSEAIDYLRTGRYLLIRTSKSPQWIKRPIDSVELRTLNTLEIIQRFGKQKGIFKNISQPFAVVTSFLNEASHVSKKGVEKKNFQVQVEIDKRSLITFLPFWD